MPIKDLLGLTIEEAVEYHVKTGIDFEIRQVFQRDPGSGREQRVIRQRIPAEGSATELLTAYF